MSRVRVRVRKRAKGMSGKKLFSAQNKSMSKKFYITEGNRGEQREQRE